MDQRPNGCMNNSGTSHPLMSSMNKLRYDSLSYTTDIKQSKGPGGYVMETPMPHCQPCFSSDARMQFGRSGHSECSDRSLIDVDSDLIGITRRASRAPSCQYKPPTSPNDICPLRHVPDCTNLVLAVQDTRLNNPPCTLRGTGWNRWEWLCTDPQEHAILSFDTGIDTSIITKDNHRPLITVPLDQTVFMPPRKYESAGASAPQWMPKDTCLNPKNAAAGGRRHYDPDDFITPLPNMHWRSCTEVKKIQEGS